MANNRNDANLWRVGNYKTAGYKRRQYEDVARILGENKRHSLSIGDSLTPIVNVQAEFVRLFTEDNARFDSARFDARVQEFASGTRE